MLTASVRCGSQDHLLRILKLSGGRAPTRLPANPGSKLAETDMAAKRTPANETHFDFSCGYRAQLASSRGAYVRESGMCIMKQPGKGRFSFWRETKSLGFCCHLA